MYPNFSHVEPSSLVYQEGRDVKEKHFLLEEMTHNIQEIIKEIKKYENKLRKHQSQFDVCRYYIIQDKLFLINER